MLGLPPVELSVPGCSVCWVAVASVWDGTVDNGYSMFTDRGSEEWGPCSVMAFCLLGPHAHLPLGSQSVFLVL